MAPKSKIDLDDPEIKSLLQLFSTIELTGQKANDALKNPKQCQSLKQILTDSNLDLKNKKLDSKVNTLIAVASTTLTSPEIGLDYRKYVVERILDGSLSSSDQVITGCKYLATLEDPNASASTIDKARFDSNTGVGVEVTKSQIESLIDQEIQSRKSDLNWSNIFQFINSIKGKPDMRWANSLEIKNLSEEKFKQVFGEKPKPGSGGNNKTAKDDKEKKEAKKEEKKAVPAVEGAKVDINAPVRPDSIFQEGFLSKLHAPGENPQISPSLKAAHLAATGGKVVTRFPPEPNGFLHIGHAKAISVDFGYAKFHNGITYLRYDDTNPSKEEEIYFDSILEMVRWLGFEPFKITYSSDYFQELFDLAIELIKKGLAYVDHSTKEEIYEQRGGKERGERKESKWSTRSVEENLTEFNKMKDGHYKPGEAILRMKQDLLGSGNPQMWDLTAYRVLDSDHHRTGSQWKIYPTYDFTHCLVDSIENISHSLCTTEFILSRESYEWLCDALEVYKPRQYEFGRLNLEGTITSKRKLLNLINSGYIKDWDDPRLFTLIALRRRGVPPGAILSFVSSLGVSNSISVTQSNRLDQSLRQFLESTTPRLMMILDPVRIKITNLPPDHFQEIEKPLHPKVPSMDNNKVPFTRDVFIDSSDFKKVDEKGYLRLAPGKTIGLMNVPGVITCTGFTVDDQDEEKIKEIQCEYEPNPKTKCKTYIQWISQHEGSKSPIRIHETRIFQPLFNCSDPGAEADFEKTINKDSLQVYKNSMIEVGFWKVMKTCVRMERKAAEEREKKVKDDENVQTSTSHGQDQKDGNKDADEDEEKKLPKRKLQHLVGNECVRFQGMRIAYFALDKDSKINQIENALFNSVGNLIGDGDADDDEKPYELKGDEKIVLNRIVSLKEDKEK